MAGKARGVWNVGVYSLTHSLPATDGVGLLAPQAL